MRQDRAGCLGYFIALLILIATALGLLWMDRIESRLKVMEDRQGIVPQDFLEFSQKKLFNEPK